MKKDLLNEIKQRVESNDFIEGTMNVNEEIYKHSELAVKKNGCKYVLLPILDWNGFKNLNAVGDDGYTFSFHPNGRTGCINCNDEYMYGIRCNHLIWMDGYFEDLYLPGILLLGNHKGMTYMNVILFTETED